MTLGRSLAAALVLAASACVATPPATTMSTPPAAPAPEPRIEIIPRTAEAADASSLSAGFEPIFAAELADRDAARAAWRDYGGRLLAQVERTIYPPIPADVFNQRALARVQAMRSGRPDATLEDLSYAALDGVYPPAWLSEHFLTAVAATRVDATSPWEDSIPLTKEAEEIDTVLIGRARTELDRAALAGTDVLVLQGIDEGDGETVERLLARRSGPLVLDLRGASSGQLADVIDIASLLAPGGELLFSIAAADEERRAYAAPAGPWADDGPVLAVIDSITDAGALMLAVSLADAGRARIAGTLGDVRGAVSAATVWGDCRSVAYRCDQSSIAYPSRVLLRADGSPLSDAVVVDYPVNAWDEKALQAVVVRWLQDVGAQ